MRRFLKSKLVLLSMLVFVLIATPVLGWVVYSNGVANVSLTVRRAEASWELTEIEVGDVNSGASFTARSKTVLTVENAETLYVSFVLVTLTDEEIAALEELTVTIGEDTNGDGEIDVMWGTMEATPINLPWPRPFPLDEGVYNVVILVEGIAGYPQDETPIAFVVEGTCDTLPVPVP